MKISDQFNLNKTQPELDFVDIDPSQDIPLFIDPFFLSLRKDNWSSEATRTIRSFFQHMLSFIRQNQIADAKLLFLNLHEPNSTCLGLSRGQPRGRGVGRGNTDDIFSSIVHSRAIQTGLMRDLEDNLLFVEGFGKDKLSDMATNIIRKHLIGYTQGQCKLHGITLSTGVPSGFFWNRGTVQWESEYTEMLVIESQKILLVPKGIVSFCKDYTPDKYFNDFVLNYLQNEHLQINSTLVQERKDGAKYVTKKDLKEVNPYSKQFLREFTQRHPEVLTDFKQHTKTIPLSDYEIGDVNLNKLVNYLIESLREIPSGSDDATSYHRIIVGILEIIFYPHLIYPTLEREIHQGRKRIDITFDNAANEGIFFRFSKNMLLPCQYIMIECKNYSSDPANPELDQLAGRFSPNRGQVGFLLCRDIGNMNLFIERCRDTYRDSRGLIIPIIDSDIILLLDNVKNLNFEFVDRYLSDRARQIAVN